MCSTATPPRLPPQQPESAQSIDSATKMINTMLPLGIVVVGCISNVLIIVAFRNQHFKRTSSSCYMLCLAVTDLSALLCLLIPHWLNAAVPRAIYRGEGADKVCKFLNFYGWCQMDFALALVAVMSHERVKMLDTHQIPDLDLVQTGKTLFAIISICAAKNFHLLFTSVLARGHAMLCFVNPTSCAYEVFLNFVWPWIHILCQGSCFVWMTVSNQRIIHYFRSRPRRFSIPQHTKLMNRVTGLLVAQSLIFTALTLPLCLHLFLINLLVGTEYIDYTTGTTPLAVSLAGLTFAITFNLWYCNKCVIFAVYVVFSKTFRKALMEETSGILRAVRSLQMCGRQSVAPAPAPPAAGDQPEDDRASDASPQVIEKMTRARPACQDPGHLTVPQNANEQSTTTTINQW